MNSLQLSVSQMLYCQVQRLYLAGSVSSNTKFVMHLYECLFAAQNNNNNHNFTIIVARRAHDTTRIIKEAP